VVSVRSLHDAPDDRRWWWTRRVCTPAGRDKDLADLESPP